jgi:hypothetical protein
MNPYQHDLTGTEQLDTERTVIIDPVTGQTVTIGARIERIRLDAHGQHRDVLHVVAPTADHEQLLFPYARPLATCACCGIQPLARPFRCAACQRPTCIACRVMQGDVTLCRDCGKTTFLQRLLSWLGNL